MIEGHTAGDGDGLRRRAHRSGHKTRLVGGGVLFRCRLRQLRARFVDLNHAILETIFGQDDVGPAEGVRFDDVGTGGTIDLMDRLDDVWPREVQVLVTAFEGLSTEIGGREFLRLNHRPHRPIHDEDTFTQERFDRFIFIRHLYLSESFH